jgi:sporulation protein YlmC with PRC-barrel domain
MRAISIAAVSAVALLTVSAYGQSQSPPGSATVLRSNAPSYSPVAPPKAPALNPMKQEDVSKIEGASVLGSDGKKIGDVSKVLMKPEDKTIDRLVVRTGGLLGVGGHHVAMPIEDFSWDTDAAAFKIAKTADELKSMAEWTEPETATPATGSSRPIEKTTSPPRSGE